MTERAAPWSGTLAVALLACAATDSRAASNDVALHPLFQNHAVLQRDRPIAVWGTAAPNAELTVTLAGASQSTRASASGEWSVSLEVMPAGGPYSLVASVRSGARQAIDDVMVGDVWLCSGQSNMVLQVHRALDSRAEIANSANDSIRLFTVPLASSATERPTFASSVEWRKAGPTTVPEFSAACLYFARELQKTIRVPMGLIASAWGGSKIEAWMSESALRETGRYDEGLSVLDAFESDPASSYARWGAHWETWWRERSGDRPGKEPWAEQAPGDWRKAPSPLTFWEQWGVAELANHNGMLWYRTSVRLSTQQAKQAATLSLGLVDEVEQTWLNGRPIGAQSAYASTADRAKPMNGAGPERTYRIPAGALKVGENVVVVNVLDTYATGGLHGPSQGRALRFADGTSVALGEWFYRNVSPTIGLPPRAPWEATAGLSTIYNSMIAPLGHIGLRGVAWYQGESNTDEAARYQDLLLRFMADWRSRFGRDLPFLIVQLANYGPAPTAPGESGWAELREAQRLAVARDAHAGLAVTIDIGERYDVHPANKQEVGRRLARAARRVAYGESIAPSGPIAVSAHKQGGIVVVEFSDVSDRLSAYSATGPIGFELCAAAPNSCRYVPAQLEDRRVVLDATLVPAATKVRYCWADSPVCTLFDGARLPAGPFQVEVQ